MQFVLVCLLGFVSLVAASPISGRTTRDIDEGGVPIHVDNRSGEKVDIVKNGDGVTVKIGDDPNPTTGTFQTPWGPVTLITSGKTTLNVNFTPKHMNIVVGLAPEEWTGEME
ncbi:unnamed protein product, partial [Mesorhabditis belari]|uniref:Uncharacterized protein n=1 Tax=Mesorhabditis belari TaxID=2138241 RepID=A0AAF3ENP4_9BILA